MRGYCGIGVYHPKTGVNIGTLVRSASVLGADFVFTIGRRYKKQASSVRCERHVPVFHFATIDAWRKAMPANARLVCVELDERSVPLAGFTHPEQAVYLLGAEDHGLPPSAMAGLQVVQIPGAFSLNVASAGTVVLYDRAAKRGAP